MPSAKLSIRSIQKSSKKAPGKERPSANAGQQLNDIIEEGLFSSSDESDEEEASVVTILRDAKTGSDLSSLSEQENKRSFLKRNKQNKLLSKIPGLSKQPSLDATVHASNREKDAKDRDNESIMHLTNYVSFSFASVETDTDSVSHGWSADLMKRQRSKKANVSAKTKSLAKPTPSPTTRSSPRTKRSPTKSSQTKKSTVKVDRDNGGRTSTAVERDLLRCSSSTSSEAPKMMPSPRTKSSTTKSPRIKSSPKKVERSYGGRDSKRFERDLIDSSSSASSEEPDFIPSSKTKHSPTKSSPTKLSRNDQSPNQSERRNGGRETKRYERDSLRCSSSSSTSEDDVHWSAGLLKPLRQRSKQQLRYKYSNSSDSSELDSLDKTLLRIARGR